MPLTKEQVQTIFQLVKEHIPYYDLQVEMVDHLASSVEEKMEVDTNISFEQALPAAYAKFDDSDFKLLIRERRSSLLKEKWTIWFQVLLQQFSTYRFIYTISIFAVAVYANLFLAKEVMEIILLLVYMSCLIMLAIGGIIRMKAKINYCSQNYLLLPFLVAFFYHLFS